MNEAVVLPDFVVIPAGVFRMGDDNGRPDERPEHDVHVSAFAIASLPVTNAEYTTFLSVTGTPAPPFLSDSRFNAPDQPIVGIQWAEAAAYCAWLSGVTARACRLPTEAEREKAARGGRGGCDYPADETELRFQQDAPFAVGRSRANGFGLHDMAYNVHEWCSDWYGANYYSGSPSRDPGGPETGTRRASRGGAWRHQVKLNRCAARSSLPPSFQYNDYGFRVACDVDP